MLPFHLMIHAAPDELPPARPRDFQGLSIEAYTLSPTQLERPLDVSFERASERLAELPRLFIEPDGSFVWVGDSSGPAWQVDGVLYDRAGRVQYVELKGNCPVERFDELLAAFDWPRQAILLQLVREALFVEAREWRRILTK